MDPQILVRSQKQKILVVNSSVDSSLGRYTEKISGLIGPTDYLPEMQHYSRVPDLTLHAYAAVIISPAVVGGVNDEKKHPNELQDKLEHCATIKEYQGPTLGICMGHQILGLLYGSDYIRDTEREVGDNYLVQIVDKDPLFDGVEGALSVKQDHNNSITLPHDFKLLATSLGCKNQVMKHKTRQLYGSQFHLEEIEQIFYRFISLVPQHKT